MRMLSEEEIERNLSKQIVVEKWGKITDAFFFGNATLYFNNIKLGTITNLQMNLGTQIESPDE